MTMRTYPVRVAREGKWWIVRATDFDHAVTQARRLADVELEARDMIAALQDVTVDEVAVEVTIEAVDGVDVDELRRSVASERAEVEAAQARYGERLRAEARRLAGNGLTVRDIGAVLSVSHQRAQQLLDGRVTS